ncbi:MAG TPA: hypothetical protein VMT45_03370 [Thermoanaerobaculaceae bacterium]|nr:hypothetical protein [Thermoanaerobaculaceae bacterium]
MNRELTQESHPFEARRPVRCIEANRTAAVCSVVLLLALTAIAALVASLL